MSGVAVFWATALPRCALPPKDLLSLALTSRSLRGDQAYSEWSLYLPPGQVQKDLSGSDLRRLLTKSLKLNQSGGNTMRYTRKSAVGSRFGYLRIFTTFTLLVHLTFVHAAWRKGISQIVFVVYTAITSSKVFGCLTKSSISAMSLVLQMVQFPHLRLCGRLVHESSRHNLCLVHELNYETMRARFDSIFSRADVPIALINIELNSLVIATRSWAAVDVEPAQVIHFMKLPPHVLETGGNPHTQSIQARLHRWMRD
ncbi:hypothetical protein AB1N83_008216 [Pleurotus pulmonarius]